MRTKSELLDILNPARRGKIFRIIPVKYNRPVTLNSGKVIDNIWVSFEEIHFDANGDFMGASDFDVYKVLGDDITDLKHKLKQLLEAADNPLITEDELKLIQS